MTARLMLTDQTQQSSGTWRLVKVGSLTAYLLCVGLGQTNSAEITCGDLQNLTSLALNNFKYSKSNSTELPRLGADECSVALGEGGIRMYFCSWGFEYRSGEARSFFGELERKLIACLKPSSPARDDQQVNHPDSFIHDTYTVSGIDLSVSVKDKSPLQKTFVFVRMQRSVTSAN